MSPEGIAALIGLGVYAAMRLIDALLPTGRHFGFVERWLAKDKPDPKEVPDE
jgi:hypothetical protein